MVDKLIETVKSLLNRNGVKYEVSQNLHLGGAYDLLVMQWVSEGSISGSEAAKWESFIQQMKQ